MVFVREFNGTSDALVTSIGGMAGATYGAAVFLVKRGTTGAWHTLSTFDVTSLQFAFNDSNEVTMWDGTEYSGGSVSSSDYVIVVVRVVEGSAPIDFSVYDYDTDSWAHSQSSASLTTWDVPTLATSIAFSYDGSADRWNGRIAARAFWNESIPWATNTDVENAGLEVGATQWLAANPSVMHIFNQENVSTAVACVVESGADQTSINGTTAVDDTSLTWDDSLDEENNVTPGAVSTTQINSPTFARLATPNVVSTTQIFSVEVRRMPEVFPAAVATTSIFSPSVIRGDADPIESGSGSLADQIMSGLVDQGFTTGSISDRERQRLGAKLGLTGTALASKSLADLYVQAEEPFRIWGDTVV